MNAPCGQPLAWHGLYKGQSVLLTPDSYSHPAKMSAKLCYRIFDHLKELGLLGSESVVLDPMGGTGLTGMVAATLGLKSVLVELEPKFIGYIQANKEALEKKLGHPVDMTIIQGDARHLGGLLSERGMIALTSPPYGEALDNKGQRHGGSGICGRDPKMAKMRYDEEVNPANIGNLPDRIVITSQAETYLSAMREVYRECLSVADVLVIVLKDTTRNGAIRELGKDTISLLETTGWQIADYHQAILFEVQEQGHMFDGVKKQPKGRLSFFKRLAFQKGSPVASYEHIIFAVNPNGRHGVTVLTSPPYQTSEGKSIVRRNRQVVANSWAVTNEKRRDEGYGSTPGQIGNLKDK